MNELISFWQNFNANKNENNDLMFIHQDDLINFENNNIHIPINSFDDYVKDGNNLFSDEAKVHTGLLPVPYAGNIRKAKIYILLTNPGFHHNDYYSEHVNKDYRQATINNIRQEKFDPDYPFLYLNPKFCHTSGGSYWLNKFKSIILELNKEFKNIDETLKHISQNICTLELFPYHSSNFKLSDSALNQFESVKKIKESINQIKDDNNKLILCLRQAKNWNLKVANNVKILDSKYSRSASLGINEDESAFGNLILNKLKELKNK